MHPLAPTALPARRWMGGFLAAIAALLVACAAPPKVAPSQEPQPFEQAVAAATDALAQQTQRLPAFLAQLNQRTVVMDPSLDAASGQQTLFTQRLDRLVTERLSAHPQFAVRPFQPAQLAAAQLLLTGTMTRDARGYWINLALTDLKTRSVVAQAAALSRPNGVDMSPLPFYRDSPVLVKDRVIDGYVRTSITPPGQPADAFYVERLVAGATINEATGLYNAERYQEALGQYRSALASPAGEQMRALTGLYLTNVRLGRGADAENAFAQVVAHGIANNELGVKFLFNPGSTDFWADTRVSGAYDMWLRQIARAGGASNVCMEIVGHTSRTGSEPFNDALSLRRAAYVRQRLGAENAELLPRTRAQGMGFRHNLIGSGTDDAVDALDRRVEFKIVRC